MPSNGLHTNGYSLARKLLFSIAGYSPETYVNAIKGKVGNELMKTHKSYWPAIRRLVEAECVSAMAHITGGGITENLPRVLPKGMGAVVELGSWPVLPIFTHMQQLGNISQDEMLRTFNMGIGMVLVIPGEEVQEGSDRSRTCRRKGLHHRPHRKRRPQSHLLVDLSAPSFARSAKSGASTSLHDRHHPFTMSP